MKKNIILTIVAVTSMNLSSIVSSANVSKGYEIKQTNQNIYIKNTSKKWHEYHVEIGDKYSYNIFLKGGATDSVFSKWNRELGGYKTKKYYQGKKLTVERLSKKQEQREEKRGGLNWHGMKSTKKVIELNK